MKILKSRTREELGTFLSRVKSGIAHPALVFFIAPEGQLARTAAAFAQAFPYAKTMGIPSWRLFDCGEIKSQETVCFCFGQKDPDVLADGLLLREISGAPVRYVLDVQQMAAMLHPGENDTACLEFCTNSEEMLVTTLTAMLARFRIPLLGGTVYNSAQLSRSDVRLKVAFQGVVYEDAALVLFLKNQQGSVLLYRENFYHIKDGSPMHLATKVRREEKALVELDGRPAAEVYSEETGIPLEKIVPYTFERPLGRLLGSDIYCISMHHLGEDGTIYNYKTVNPGDAIYFLELSDYRATRQETYARIARELPERQFVLAIDCVYRYLFYEGVRDLENFERERGALLGAHYGVLSSGEQFRHQVVNQTGVYLAFEGKAK